MKKQPNNTKLPKPAVEQCGRFFVVRDDLLPGGTKRRALVRLMQPGEEYVYASPAYGHAQLALALAAVDTGASGTVFVAQRAVPHALTAAARAAGAKIIEVPHGYLNVVQARARQYTAGGFFDTPKHLVPFGLDCEEVIAVMAEAAAEVPCDPPEVWCAAGSGVLTRALQRRWPSAKHYAVQVGRPPKVDGATLLQAPERYEQAAGMPPPFPSCVNYDAKVWRFFVEQAAPGALYWNVAP